MTGHTNIIYRFSVNRLRTQTTKILASNIDIHKHHNTQESTTFPSFSPVQIHTPSHLMHITFRVKFGVICMVN